MIILQRQRQEVTTAAVVAVVTKYSIIDPCDHCTWTSQTDRWMDGQMT